MNPPHYLNTTGYLVLVFLVLGRIALPLCCPVCDLVCSCHRIIVITFPMTRRRFEDICKVPNGERLTGRGWIASFCKTYKLKERRRHGEAGSVDPLEVEAERERIRLILAAYQPKDCWNVDESSLNPL